MTIRHGLAEDDDKHLCIYLCNTLLPKTIIIISFISNKRQKYIKMYMKHSSKKINIFGRDNIGIQTRKNWCDGT